MIKMLATRVLCMMSCLLCEYDISGLLLRVLPIASTHIKNILSKQFV